ncbi:MAG TPA: hypothetical protein VEK57_10945 [Thermoanaerobaculia bacterium]|nr:hypothetical protein [Thermoanaerobaculia bacterium]
MKAPKEGEAKAPNALSRKLAAMATFAPGTATEQADSPGGFADQDWYEKSIDGASNEPPGFTAFATARNDWFGLKARPAVGNGKWEPYGPTNGVNDMTNPFRDRTVYNAGTQNFTGRTVHAVISPDCNAGECNLWIANANGGVWLTHNALAVDDPLTAEYEGPEWEYMSETFESNSVASLELDPNDSDHKTIWAGTGEPNACGSGCEVGVGIYQSKSGGVAWKGPLGAENFFGRAVGSIEVKPGDSKTIFAASGRAVRGVSTTCCGGTDALIPGAPHFGVWRSKNEGKTWELVNQGANALCTASTPDAVSLNTTACSPRGARRIKIDPVDPNTVYASFFARGIWRSRSNGDPGTWEQILPRIGPATNTAERSEFDVVLLPNGETRMYAGIGGGGIVAHFRRNDNVRSAPAATVAATWLLMTNTIPDTPGYSSFGYCDGQCSYDNYVYVPPASSGADHNTVYLSGVNQYNENNTGSGRSNGRAVLVSTDGGATFTDMTEDDASTTHPGALHPDHHALVVNPANWRQFFDFGDGGVVRSNGVFVNDAADCTAPPHSFVVPSRIAFCQMVLSRVPQKLEAINRGLRTLHFYQIEYDPKNPERLAGGTQDNGSWETLGDKDTWVNSNIADGGHNAFDAPGGDPGFRLTGWQSGQLEVSFTPQNQLDTTWISDTLFVLYGNETTPFIASAITDPVTPAWLWTGREHVFRSQNHGLNPLFPRPVVELHCNVWFGNGDLDEDGTYEPLTDICDDWKPLGDPGPNGRLTAAIFGDRAGGHISNVERGRNDTGTVWATTSTGRVFIAKNADDPNPAAVQFVRLDSTDTDDPPRYPTSIYVDPADSNHAWITYSGYNSKTPATPGHVFEVTYVPASGSTPASGTFTNLDGHKINGYGDIPANSIIVTPSGTLYVGNDYGVVQKQKNSSVWHLPAAGLPNVNVPDLVYVPEKDGLYAATHGQGIWFLKVQ